MGQEPGQTRTQLARRAIESIDWSAVEVLRGTGADLSGALSRFLEAETPELVAESWWGLEGLVFAQNTIYGAAEPTVEVLMAALADSPPAFHREWLVEALRFILSGDSIDDRQLRERCLAAAGRGTWLLASEACRAETQGYRLAVLEVLEMLDPVVSGVVREGLAGPR